MQDGQGDIGTSQARVSSKSKGVFCCFSVTEAPVLETTAESTPYSHIPHNRFLVSITRPNHKFLVSFIRHHTLCDMAPLRLMLRCRRPLGRLITQGRGRRQWPYPAGAAAAAAAAALSRRGGGGGGGLVYRGVAEDPSVVPAVVRVAIETPTTTPPTHTRPHTHT